MAPGGDRFVRLTSGRAGDFVDHTGGAAISTCRDLLQV